MELLIALRLHLMRYTRFVHFQNLASIRIYLIFYTCLMLKHEVALNKSGIKFAGIITTPAAADAFVLGVLQLHNTIYLRTGTGTVGR